MACNWEWVLECRLPVATGFAIKIAQKSLADQTVSERLLMQISDQDSQLPAGNESPLPLLVVGQQEMRSPVQQAVDACMRDWNAVLEAKGSFADEHSTL